MKILDTVKKKLKKKTITENEIKNIVTELNNKYDYYKNNTELLNAISQINNLENRVSKLESSLNTMGNTTLNSNQFTSGNYHIV